MVAVLGLADLRLLQVRGAIEARILSALASAGQPVNQWSAVEAGGVERSIVRMSADGLAQVVAPRLVQMAEMRFLDLAVGDALTIYAKKRFKLDRFDATFTIQNVKLTSSIGAPPYDFAPGDLVVGGAGGNVYKSIERITIQPGGTGQGKFEAETAGSSANDVAGAVTKMITAPAGVSCVNAAPSNFAPTSLIGFSTGTIRAEFPVGPPTVAPPPPGATGLVKQTFLPGPPLPPAFGSVRISIDVSGNIGTGFFSWSIDGGTTWDRGHVIQSAPFAIDDGTGTGGGALVSFFNDPSGTNVSFVQGDIFTLLVASAIIQQGADAESDAALRRRCRGRWAMLSDVPTDPLINLWCHQASPEVDRVRSDADLNSPGSIQVTIASSTGPASPAAIIAVQDYITARLKGFQGLSAPGATTAAGLLGSGSPEERVLVSTAVARQVAASGTVTVPRARLVAAQQQADALWTAYLGSVGIGGTVRLAELYQAVMDAGAIEAVGLAILVSLPGGGLITGADVTLNTGEIPVPGGTNGSAPTLTAMLAWKPV